MLLRMIELNQPIDEIIFYDTTVEFPQMYEHINRVEEYIKRPITRLRAKKDFEYYLLYHKPKIKEGSKNKNGYSFPYFHGRWCTRIKTQTLDAHFKDKRKFNIKQYVGIAADEYHRIKDKIYPLIEWGWTERDCLKYCCEKGFDFGGLYEIFNRVSCWCCPLQPLGALRQLRKHFPELWEKILDWQSQTWRAFRPDYDAIELETRFKREDCQLTLF